MAPVRVALDASSVPAAPGGAGRYVLDLAVALAERPDVDMTVLCRVDDRSRWEALAPNASVAAAGPARRPLRLIWEQARIPALLRTLAVQVHHGPHYTMPARAPVPVVVTVHDLSLLEHPEWHQRSKVAFFGPALRLAAARADALIAVSSATAGRLTALLAPRGPVRVIPHGVDHGRFFPGPVAGDSEALARLGLAGPYIAFLGTLEPRKDVPTLVRAFSRLAPGRPELTLVLAGAPGWGMEDVGSAIATSPVPDRVRLIGYVAEADKAPLLRGATAVAYPSLEEGFGLPALEALACGAPLVTTTGSSMEEVVDDGALLVGPGDVDGLAGALEAILEGGPDVEGRRRRGLAVAARFTWAASAEAHAEVYHSVLR